jgi:prevent-host-death family protein
MQIASSKLKQQINILSSVRNEDIIITKRNKPFAVVIDYDKYQQIMNQINKQELEKKLNALNSLQSFSLGGKDYKDIKSEVKI